MRANFLIVIAACAGPAAADFDALDLQRLFDTPAAQRDASLPGSTGWYDPFGGQTERGLVTIPKDTESIDIGGDRRYSPVPAPGSVLLVGAGVAAACRRRRR